MIKRLYVDNYKCLVNFELPLQEMTLLVGQNGVGKSSVLDVIFALQRLLSGKGPVNATDIFPSTSRTRWQQRDQQVFELDVTLGKEDLRYRLEVRHEEGDRLARVQRETLTAGGRSLFSFELGEVQLYRDDHSEGPSFDSDWYESALARVPARSDNGRLSSFLDFIRSVIVCGLYPRSFSTDSTGEEPGLERDGANFSSWYRHLVQEHGDSSEFRSALQAAIDGFQKLRLEKVGTKARALVAVFGKGTESHELRLDELSDGQRALLVLYAFLHFHGKRGSALFLDEPDNYLALPEIQPWLLALNDAIGETVPQAVICSHHPEVIDYLGGDRGLLLEREVSGVVKTRPLTEVGLPDAMKLSEVIARGWQR